MDDELDSGSTAPTGMTPTGPNLHDWNTGLVGPDPFTGPDADSLSGTTDMKAAAAAGPAAGPATGSSRPGRSGRGPSKPRPEWRDPAELPGVQRAHTGAFGQKLQALDDAARTVMAVMDSIDVNALSDPEVVALTQMVERTGRPVDAARVATATVVGYRSRSGLGTESLAWRLGASHQNDLLIGLTGTSVPEMKRRVALGEKVAPRMLGGMVLEPEFPFVAAALSAGEIGLDAAENIVKGLADYKVHGRFDADQLLVDGGEAELVESATGSVFGRTPGPGDIATATDADDAGAGAGAGQVCTGPVRRLGASAGFTFPADRIREMAATWQAVLNPDGAAPTAEILEAKSTFSFGKLAQGLHPLRGGVTPELKGIMQNLFDTFLSARSAPAFPSAEEQQRIEAGELVPGEILDERDGGQKRADILRGILVQVAQDPRTPTMGGMPPTVMVHVNATDLINGVGVGWIDGVEGPIPMKTINQMVDNGGFRPILFGGTGAVLALGDTVRCFTPLQRRAITARDGGCIIPGCTCPPQWTEVHHVTPWQHGGPTNVSNGVLLCWRHHHNIDTSGWHIRMVLGMPEVKAPHWIDPTDTWRKPPQHRAHDPKYRRQDE
ncbi:MULTISPECIES: HNH endonuclease signature motif containing protein [unclassified Cryobacterium]|uniref:HNH endonuclease signature motif containing protein n=2 Tax=Cryobacterium TaxID=69578 RepID=UPI00106B99F8|nr:MULTISPECIES: HNH endonuclease signature motif containing protein [unclassified Cryobacterium]TFC69226.1 HNH endonuclease [Cryobacterium sp. TMB3-15]TFC75976.1 HNH endonuclease [Cryobacterium sp. TMB3-10]TFD40478.1 HNH endonuclease [Cryobacterium sp. TMB3-12]